MLPYIYQASYYKERVTKGEFMQVDKVIREIVKRSSQTMRGVSRMLGKGQSWCKVVSLPGRSPALSTVVDIADACGFDLVARCRDTGDELLIDPSMQGSDE